MAKFQSESYMPNPTPTPTRTHTHIHTHTHTRTHTHAHTHAHTHTHTHTRTQQTHTQHSTHTLTCPLSASKTSFLADNWTCSSLLTCLRLYIFSSSWFVYGIDWLSYHNFSFLIHGHFLIWHILYGFCRLLCL